MRQTFDFPINDPDTPGTVTPVKSTWDGYSLLSILELNQMMKRHTMFVFRMVVVVLLSRSELSRSIELLMEDTDEEWSTFRPSVTGFNFMTERKTT